VRKALKWVSVGLGTLIGLIVIVALLLILVGGAKLRRTFAVEAEAVPIPTDSVTLARGGHLVHLICADCHGADLTGAPLMDSSALGTIYAANITGMAAMRSDADLVRAIRHAVAPGGRALAIMPSASLMYLSKEDLGAVIAYLKTIPRSGEPKPLPHFTFLAKALLGAGMFKVFPAAYIDHHMPFPQMPEIGANVATGEYYSRLCYECHGNDLGGGKPPDPSSPPAPSLAIVRQWSESDFQTLAQTGKTPEGRQLDPQYMPWTIFQKLSPDELQGLYLYLHSRR
jgi:mono/diheme cytochrome c family protein